MVLVASERRWALVHELRGEAEPGLASLLGRLSPVDLVIVEGYKAFAHPKIEIFRQANGKPHLYGEAPNVRAIASDVPVPGAALALAEPVAAVVAALDGAPPLARLRIAARP